MKYRSSFPRSNSHETELTSEPPQTIESMQNDFPIDSSPFIKLNQQANKARDLAKALQA